MKAQTATPFKVRQTSTGHITNEQLALVLGCIAADALVLKDMASRCCDVAPDTDSVNTYCTAIGAIAERLAWAADTASGGLPGVTSPNLGISEFPAALFLPPLFSKGDEA
jgi:hypothetical protein